MTTLAPTQVLSADEVHYSKDLPRVALQLIFQCLPYNSLRSAALVCKGWNDVIVSSSKVWSKFKILVDENNVVNLEHLSRQICSVKLLTVNEEILEAVQKRQGLTSLTIDIDGTSLKSVEADVLSGILKNIPRIELNAFELTTEELNELFRKFCDSENVKQISLNHNDLSALDPSLLTYGLKHVTCLNISSTELTGKQASAIFSMINTNTYLNELDVGYNKLELVDPEILSSAIIKLKVIGLELVEMTIDQWTALFEAMATNQSRLIEAKFNVNDLSELDPLILSAGVTNVVKVNLEETDLTSEQASHIFDKISKQQTKLRELNIGQNRHCLAETDASTLAKCGFKLVSLDLFFTKMCDYQLKIMVKRWSSNAITLKRLMIDSVYLDGVNANHLADVINKLEVADLRLTKLKNRQLKSLLSKITNTTSLKDLNMSVNDLSKVDPELLAKAVNNIEQVDLSDTHLTDQQASAILRQCETRTKLTHLNMDDNDLDPIEVSEQTKRIVEISQSSNDSFKFSDMFSLF